MGNTENHLSIAMLKYFWAEIAKTPLTSSAVSQLVEFLALLSGETLLFCYFFYFLGLSFGKFFSVHNLLRHIYCTGRKASLLFHIRWDDGQGVLGFELNATQVSQPAVAGLGSQEVLNNHKHLQTTRHVLQQYNLLQNIVGSIWFQVVEYRRNYSQSLYLDITLTMLSASSLP